MLTMPTPIVEHVRQRMMRLLGGGDRGGMIAVDEHRSAPIHEPVDSAGGRDLQRLHATRELHAAVCLNEEVDMVALQRNMDHAKSAGTIGDAAGCMGKRLQNLFAP
jgi:hypothetical protein